MPTKAFKVPAYGLVTPQRYAELITSDILPVAIDAKLNPVTDNLTQSLAKRFNEEKEWISGVALEAGVPGSNFQMHAGLSRA